jgi:hypothetical protein
MNKALSRICFLLLGLTLLALPARAQVQHGDMAYAVKFRSAYAFNKTYSHYATFDVGAFMPVNEHLELQADIRLATTNNYAFGLQVRPKITLPVGALYFETRAISTVFARNQIFDLTAALMLGYRMQYIDVAIGWGTKVIGDMNYQLNTNSEYITEPFNLLYKVQCFVRPQSSPWNLSLAIMDITDWQIERFWQPSAMLSGWYNVDQHWRIYASLYYKTAGMFHLNANMYGIEARVGFDYRF